MDVIEHLSAAMGLDMTSSAIGAGMRKGNRVVHAETGMEAQRGGQDHTIKKVSSTCLGRSSVMSHGYTGSWVPGTTWWSAGLVWHEVRLTGDQLVVHHKDLR